jgi:hypothetical protein
MVVVPVVKAHIYDNRSTLIVTKAEADGHEVWITSRCDFFFLSLSSSPHGRVPSNYNMDGPIDEIKESSSFFFSFFLLFFSNPPPLSLSLFPFFPDWVEKGKEKGKTKKKTNRFVM